MGYLYKHPKKFQQAGKFGYGDGYEYDDDITPRSQIGHTMGYRPDARQITSVGASFSSPQSLVDRTRRKAVTVTPAQAVPNASNSISDPLLNNTSNAAVDWTNAWDYFTPNAADLAALGVK